MLDSSKLAQMMEQFEKNNGPVKTQPIITRDYMSPNGGFMMTSGNDAPKPERPQRTPAVDKALDVMQARHGLTTDQIMAKAGVSRGIVHAAARSLGYALASKRRGAKPDVSAAIVAAANSLTLEMRTIARVARLAKTSSLYASRIMRENNIKYTRKSKWDKE